MAVSPSRLHILQHRRRQNKETSPIESHGPDGRATDCPTAPAPAQQILSSESRASSRPTRHRATSYYSPFQTSCSPSSDAPPLYSVAIRPRPRVTRSLTEGSEPLPSYSCTVAAECKILLNWESANPLTPAPGCDNEWREVFLVLRGTLLSLHRVKDGGPGKLIRAYTLQHAEIGLATDSQHTVLIPKTRLAHLIPSAARRRAWLRDPDLFTPVRQSLLRLRVETDQLLLADSDEERIHALIHALSAAIDISQALDERAIPKQCTVPRRRRRRPRQQFNGDLTDPGLVAEQERIMQQMYPGLTGVVEAHSQADLRPSQAPNMVTGGVNEAPLSPSREEEEIDFSMIREDLASASMPRSETHDRPVRPNAIRTTTTTTIDSTFSEDMMFATPVTNFDDEGKWQPPHHRSDVQVQRYIKRCMPILLAEANRASDIVIVNGKRMKINWRMELLEEWELQPPKYKAHIFETHDGLARSSSQRSGVDSAGQALQQSTSSILASEDDLAIQPEQGVDTIQLSKVVSSVANIDTKCPTQQSVEQDAQGVVFCF